MKIHFKQIHSLVTACMMVNHSASNHNKPAKHVKLLIFLTKGQKNEVRTIVPIFFS